MASKVLVKTVNWSATNLPSGMSIDKDGVISGKPTGAVGDYIVPVRVKTAWGTQTKNVTIHVRNRTPFSIFVDGTEVASIKLSDLMAKIADGTAQSEYGIGAQLIVPYTDPFTGTTYDCPFNFGTFREFELEDGTKFNGLGLQTHYLLPVTSGDGVQFDAPEPSNTNGQRASEGNNRYLYSAVRQWMNKSGIDWWESQHSADAAPNNPTSWTTVNGLLSCFPTEFVDALQPVKIITKTSTTDGSGLDTVYDKFFLLSTREMNIVADSSNTGLLDDTEGAYWEYWRQHNELSDYRAIGQAFANGIQYKLENHEEAGISWLRSVRLQDSDNVWIVNSDGSVASGSMHVSTPRRVAPACVLAPAV